MFRERVDIKYNVLKYCYTDNNGVPPSVGYNYRKVEVDFYSENIRHDHFGDVDTIHLMLDYEKGVSRKLRDFIFWSIGKPTSNIIICSLKFKLVLETLNLPRYKIYPAEIDVGKKVYQYYVLHYINNYLEDIDYKNSQFATSPYIKCKPISHIFNIGEITDYETYKKLEIESLTNNMECIFPLKIKFLSGKHYDIWNFNGHHIISESAMDKILAANITGVAMPPLAETELDFLEIS